MTGGRLPSTIEMDMGIMDVKIKTGPSGKPELDFDLDRKQLTTSKSISVGSPDRSRVDVDEYGNIKRRVSQWIPSQMTKIAA
jgi:hypothetical protein